MAKGTNGCVRQFKQLLMCALFAGVPLMTVPAAADAGASELKVTATVAKRVSLKVLRQPLSVLITKEDLVRGYVAVAAPVEVFIQSNSPDGYMLVVDGRGGFVRQARMRGLGYEVLLDGNGGLVPQRSKRQGVLKTTRELTFNFILAEHATVGEHPGRCSFRPFPFDSITGPARKSPHRVQ